MLDLYSNFLALNPYTFFGINYTAGNYHSNKIWTYSERSQVDHAMAVSRAELEHNLGYLLMPEFTVAEPHFHNHSFVRLNHAFVITLGTQTVTSLADGTPDYTTEPGTLQITTAVPDAIHIYNPDTSVEITSSQRSYTGGVLTLSIPRYALIKDMHNPVEGWDFTDMDNFLTTVLVKSIVIDTTQSVQAGYTLALTNAKMGLVEVLSPAYSQSWYDLCVAPTTQTMLINYQSGLQEQDFLLKNIWVNFAHARLDIQPTEDASVKLKWLWARDIPKQLSSMQSECPFGQFTGAYQAWRYINTHRLHRATPL